MKTMDATISYEVSSEPARIRDLPQRLRPRELFDRVGPRHVPDRDLLAILLRSGRPGLNALDVADRLLKQYGSLTQLARAHGAELTRIPGIGPAKAREIKAAFELSRRLMEEAAPPGTEVGSPEQAARVLQETARVLTEEVFWILPLDARNRLAGHPVEISRGIVNASLVHPREVFRRAIDACSVSLILVHNHPSGDTAPSAEDLKIARQLVQTGRTLDIPVLDHIILGKRLAGQATAGYLSLREAGLVEFGGMT